MTDRGSAWPVRCRVVWVAVLGILLVHGRAVADWPMYRADAARSGYSADPLPGELTLQWTYRGAAPAPAWTRSMRMAFDFAHQPIIVGNDVVFGCSATDKVTALDAGSGEVNWEFFAGGPVRFAPVAWQDRIFVASDDGCLYALRRQDGTLLWMHRGGPNDRRCLGNGRMISRWPARGGPVLFDDVLYYAAGIWPSDGIFLHALDPRTGEVLWTNDDSGGIYMPQPHGGANAASGVPPQGYLLANQQRLFVPTGRAVPAAFRREDGRFEYYQLQQNGSIGGARALLADRFVINAGCFLEQATGALGARAGRGVFSALPDGILQYTGDSLLAYRWADLQRTDRRGNPVSYRGLEEVGEIEIATAPAEKQLAETVIDRLPSLGDLYRAVVRFKEHDDTVPRQTGLARTLAQSRPGVEGLGASVHQFLATAYERDYEVIAAGSEAICGAPDIVRIVDLESGRVRWSHPVNGAALGLAVANGRLIVATTTGAVYCFAPGADNRAAAVDDAHANERQQPNDLPTEVVELAQDILAKTGVTEGICLDLGCGSGELARALAERSELHVIGIEADAERVAEARWKLDQLGLYGRRISVHQGDSRRTPYPQYCADLVISSRALRGETDVWNQAEVERLQRPSGGVVCSGSPGRLVVSRRGALPGSGAWTHQNADPANTLCAEDELVRGPLEVAWYRDGLIEIADRHAQGPAPLVNRGCLVVMGVHGLCAVDAYSGRTRWTYDIPGILADWDGVHHDVGVGDTGSNFCLSDDSVFVRTGNRCLRIDLETGRLVREFQTPVDDDAKDRNWGYVAFSDGLLFGSVANDEHTISPRYADISLRNESVLFFAFDAETGDVVWKYRPRHSIRNNAIALSGGRVYLIDRPLALADRITALPPDGKHRPLLKPGEHPGGVLLAFDSRTGLPVWETADDVFGTQLAVSRQHEVLLMYYQGVKHSFFKLPSEIGGRMAAFSTETGARVWDIAADYKTRPLINGEVIYAEGGAWRLKTGEPVPWEFERSYGCGQICGSTHLMLFRSATLGYLDLTRDAGTENWGGIRPGCWFNAIPAGGLVLVPDGSSKCACSYQTQAWVALQPKSKEGVTADE
ncbi:MAG: PQQ-binding-like beta-propeller repeat protein [Thermoguttaceae bacterium]|nr:PQQ-binding-like beta-propeller repeat protein [Thermoguttaceae bacterium]